MRDVFIDSGLHKAKQMCACVFQKYLAVGELGKATDTLDATGSVVMEKNFGNKANTSQSEAKVSAGTHDAEDDMSQCVCDVFYSSDHITRVEIEEKLKTFTGDIMQVPPL